ncbi:unnamed protein product [Paramecium sonneborni]|uniref:Uncharacterized protein n=1 Tax=Paramecium sonneborni TaxID=65129 RepID=A0A8S1Q080_9CILI|nr:unnamed protein product [Paramecium sonneborni]
MSTKRQNQKEKQKIMPTIQEHNNLVADIPKTLSSEGTLQSHFSWRQLETIIK